MNVLLHEIDTPCAFLISHAGKHIEVLPAQYHSNNFVIYLRVGIHCIHNRDNQCVKLILTKTKVVY